MILLKSYRSLGRADLQVPDVDKSKYSADYVRMCTLDVMESLPEFFADSAILLSSVDSNSRPEQKMSDVFYSESNIKFDVSSGYELIPEESVPQFLKAWIASYALYPREIFDEFFIIDKNKVLKPILNYNHNDHFTWEFEDGEKIFWERFEEFGAKRYIGDCGSEIHYVCEPEMAEKLIALEKQFDSEEVSKSMQDIPLHKRNWIEPHWIDYGEHGDYCYIQSDWYFLDDLIHLCPNLLRGKWAVLTSFDSRPLVPPGTMPDWEYNIPTQVKTSYDLPLAGEGDEMYFFDREVKVEELQSLTKIHDFGMKRLSESDESFFENSWKHLKDVDVDSYISNQNLNTFIMKDKELAKEFQQTDFYKNVATLHLVEMESWTQAHWGLETVPEKCTQEGCVENRVKFGANCPRHHFIMLTGHDPQE